MCAKVRHVPACPFHAADKSLDAPMTRRPGSPSGVPLFLIRWLAALAPVARAFLLVAHAAQKPVARGRDVNDDGVAVAGIGKPIRLIEPTAHGARMALDLSGKGRKFEEVVE